MADLSRHPGCADWFVAVPDGTSAASAAQSVERDGCAVLRHASGRPWLVGRWASGCWTASAGDARVAVLGTAEPTSHELTSLAELARSGRLTEMCRRASLLAGSSYVVASSGGTVTARGSASGLRRVYRANVHGVQLAADRASTLADAVGAAPDRTRLAAALLTPSATYPLDTSCHWQQVDAVRPDHYVQLDGSGGAREACWWSAPDPVVPLAEGAQAVRDALHAAVGVRMRSSPSVSSDLSGGLDSTSLAFLAAEHHPHLTTVRLATTDPASDDPYWAKVATDALPGTHLVVTLDEVLDAADGRLAPLADTEEPGTGVLAHALLGHTARLLAEHGSSTHLAGYGGDEVSMVSRSYLHGMLRSRPVRAVGHLRAHRALRRWSLSATLRALGAASSYGRWLDGAADALTDPPPAEGTPQFGYAPELRLPPWATAESVQLVRGVLTAARDTTALAADRAQHRAVTTVWAGTQAARRVARVLATAGVELAVPYFDDAVMTAALSVDLADRGTPWRYKAVLAEAMRGVLPDQLRDRRTKAAFAADGLAGHRRMRGALLEMCEDPLLARLGVVDADRLRRACLDLDPAGRTWMELERTMAVEHWLRAATTSTLHGDGRYR